MPEKLKSRLNPKVNNSKHVHKFFKHEIVKSYEKLIDNNEFKIRRISNVQQPETVSHFKIMLQNFGKLIPDD